MAAVDADRPVNVAVVGMSYWGPNLARNFDRLADSTLRWACDLDEELLDRHRAAFPLTRFTTNLDEVLAVPETDAVVIATPVPTHAALALKVIAAGKHVFVEKPLALTTADARAVAEAAQAGDEQERSREVEQLHHELVVDAHLWPPPRLRNILSMRWVTRKPPPMLTVANSTSRPSRNSPK